MARIAANVNADMIGASPNGSLYCLGATNWPVLRAIVADVATLVRLPITIGHDTGALEGAANWISQSDAASFHAVGVPIASCSAEPTAAYHSPLDNVEHIDPVFVTRAAAALRQIVRRLDAELPAVNKF